MSGSLQWLSNDYKTHKASSTVVIVYAAKQARLRELEGRKKQTTSSYLQRTLRLQTPRGEGSFQENASGAPDTFSCLPASGLLFWVSGL